MSEDDKALIYNLRSLARMEHTDLSIGDEAADAIERLTRELSEATARAALSDAPAPAQSPAAIRDAALKEAVERAKGNYVEDGLFSLNCERWTPDSDYGRGRLDAAAAILALREKGEPNAQENS